MFNIILDYCNDLINKQDEVDYFFCTYRLQYDYSPPTLHPLPQMVYQRMKPIWANGQQLYLICSLTSSAMSKVGNLRMYNKDRSTYEEYNFTTKRWNKKLQKLLTERERTILILAQQGKNSREIAEKLYKSQNTIRNQIGELFSKLNVHSMQEAIEVAEHHRIL